MLALSSLRDNLIDKATALDGARARLAVQPTDAAAWLQARLADEAFVLFCGVGISIPPPASAPTFVDLRNRPTARRSHHAQL